MRIVIVALTFVFFFEVVAPQVVPYGCVGAFRTCEWTLDGPGGSYGYVDYMGADYVRLGPCGEVSVGLLKRGALSAFVALIAAAFAGDIGIPTRTGKGGDGMA
jgi:hypothetical protein